MDAVPNTYAALFKGPPISTAIIPATNAPSNTELTPFICASPVLIAIFKAPTGGSMIKVINAPINNTPSSGYSRTGFNPSRPFGSLSKIFFNNWMIRPAANPATKAPRKPDFPFAAIAPPTKPTTSPGRSAILMAI